MPLYNYTALKDGQYTIKGKMTAESSRQVRAKIRAMGLMPIKVFEDKKLLDKAKKGGEENLSTNIKSLSLQEQIDFTSIFQILVSSGIPLVESLLFI